MDPQDYSLQSFKGGYDNNLTYLVNCSRTREQFLVDAAVAPKEIKPFITGRNLYLFITHTHGDHIAFVREYIEAWPQLVICMYHKSIHPSKYPESVPLKHGDIHKVGKLYIKSIYTPGHFHDSMCFLMAGIIFTGDTLFVGRTGRTVYKGGDTRMLYKSIEKILSMPGNTIIYPGHDYGEKPYITLEENIQISPLLRAGNENDFLKRMAEYESGR
ncbi:MAG: MBL fold metallo-hydrolase [Candidatus Neomarinimicrobiota bacterium]